MVAHRPVFSDGCCTVLGQTAPASDSPWSGVSGFSFLTEVLIFLVLGLIGDLRSFPGLFGCYLRDSRCYWLFFHRSGSLPAQAQHAGPGLLRGLWS